MMTNLTLQELELALQAALRFGPNLISDDTLQALIAEINMLREFHDNRNNQSNK